MFARTLIAAALLFASTTVLAALPEPVALKLQEAGIPEQAVGIVVLRGDTTLLSHGASQSMQPASTIKLLTTLVGLEQLGPIFRGRTELRSSAEQVGSVLEGDLYLRGGADADFNEDVLNHMLEALRNQGIRKIRGDIVLDRQLFQPPRDASAQAQFDEFPYAYYNVVPDAFLINTNLLRLDLKASGKTVKPTMLPELEKVSVRSELSLSDAPCARWSEGWQPPEYVRKGGRIEVVLHGSFPKNCTTSTRINVLDTRDYLARLLLSNWRRLGGSVGGDVREAGLADATPAGSRLLAEHVSRALPEVLRDINKQSDNTLARTLFLSLGSLETDKQLGSRPLPPAADTSTAARAEQTIRGWLRAHQIDAEGLVLENGSGLSRLERIRPDQMAALLQAGLRSPWAPEFLSSLPIGALDGTMRNRLKDSPAALRARLKTGGLSNVAAIAGYVQDANNQTCVVVAMINHDLVAGGTGRAVLDTLVDWVARSGAQP